MKTRASEMLTNAILVVAHPDDEILWFSSVVDKVDEVLFCFGDYPALPALGEGRRRIVEELPLKRVSSLGIEESGAFSGADWERPVETSYGLEIVHGRRPARRYRETYSLLEEQLAERLRPYANVITHNPWGEYGHEDHVQVYRAIETLQRDIPFRLWFSNYAGNRSVRLMLDHFSGFDTRYLSLPTNPDLAKTIEALYRKHGCWTWYADYRWFDEECFLPAPECPTKEVKHGRLFPINMLKTDFPSRPRKQPGRIATAKRAILRKLRIPNRLGATGRCR